MWNKKSSFQSFSHYEYEKVLQNKQKLAKVQSTLTLYQRNNKNLIHQVKQLIRQNQILKNQNTNTTKYKMHQPKSPEAQITKSSVVDLSKSNQQQTIQSTIKKLHNQTFLKTNQNSKSQQKIALLQENLKNYQKARFQHQNYNHLTEYEHFKQKLSSKKKQFANNNQNLQISRNVYLQPVKQIKPAYKPQVSALKQTKAKNSFIRIDQSSSNTKNMIQNSPITKIQQKTQHSPQINNNSTRHQRFKSDLLPSAIRDQQINISYVDSLYRGKNGVNSYFQIDQKSKQQINYQAQQFGQLSYVTHNSKVQQSDRSKRRKFLSLVSKETQHTNNNKVL